jgi:hypothetical protein
MQELMLKVTDPAALPFWCRLSAITVTAPFRSEERFHQTRWDYGSAGCVAWLFDSKGIISIDAIGKDTDDVTLQAIDAGGDDVKVEDGTIDIYTRPTELEMVKRTGNRKKLWHLPLNC